MFTRARHFATVRGRNLCNLTRETPDCLLAGRTSELPVKLSRTVHRGPQWRGVCRRLGCSELCPFS